MTGCKTVSTFKMYDATPLHLAAWFCFATGTNALQDCEAQPLPSAVQQAFSNLRLAQVLLQTKHTYPMRCSPVTSIEALQLSPSIPVVKGPQARQTKGRTSPAAPVLVNLGERQPLKPWQTRPWSSGAMLLPHRAPQALLPALVQATPCIHLPRGALATISKALPCYTRGCLPVLGWCKGSMVFLEVIN
jgi:hypothetical protein